MASLSEQRHMAIEKVYNNLPQPLRSVIRDTYYRVHPNLQSKKDIEKSFSEFINYYFESYSEFEDIKSELDTGDIRSTLDQIESNLKGQKSSLNPYYRDYYALIRKLEPDVVVETGVAGGVSTTFSLLALEKNGDSGELYSIEYPQSDYHKQGTGKSNQGDPDIGYLVPDHLEGRWELIFGKSQRELPKLLLEIGGVDVFLHDSEHSISCMSFEFELAWEWLNEGGVVISDDVNDNQAFDIFINQRNPKVSGRINRSLGYFG